MAIRNKKWALYHTTGKDSDYKRYKECRNLVVKELRKARKASERKLASDVESNPKSFYRYVRILSPCGPGYGLIFSGTSEAFTGSPTIPLIVMVPSFGRSRPSIKSHLIKLICASVSLKPTTLYRYLTVCYSADNVTVGIDVLSTFAT